MSVEDIKSPVKEEMVLFEEKFKSAMKSEVALLDKITHYIIKRKGKQLRPLFVFLSAKMLGPVKEGTYLAASLIELLHTATLVHDDVVDDASERRGFLSINALALQSVPLDLTPRAKSSWPIPPSKILNFLKKFLSIKFHVKP
mgnify:CR=1 FL=1